MEGRNQECPVTTSCLLPSPVVHCGTWMESGPLTVTLILHTADVKESTPSCQELVMPQSPVAM